jgi:hypothetical protein
VPLLPAERAQYSAIIDGILASGDLQTISAKQIRKGLEAKLDIDISDKKVCLPAPVTFQLPSTMFQRRKADRMDDQVAVQELILERFDHAQNISSAPIPTTETSPKPSPAAVPTTNGHVIKTASKVKRESTPSATTSSPSISTPSASVPKSEPDSDSEEISPPKKKRKANKEVDDAKLAAMLQAQENSRARSTRGGGSKKANKVAKKPRKKREKSAKKIKADDDSEVELGSDGEVKQKEKKGGFHKQYHLSVALAELVNAPTVCSLVIYFPCPLPSLTFTLY